MPKSVIRYSVEQQKYKSRRTVALLSSTTYANMIVDAKDIPIISALFLIIDCAYWTISHVRISIFIHCYLFSHIIVRYIIHFHTQNGESRIPGNIDNIHLCVDAPTYTHLDKNYHR